MSALIVILGLVVLFAGLLARLGKLRRAYVIRVRAMWGEVARYGAIPLGGSLIVLGVVISGLLPEEVERIGGWIVATMFLVTMVLGAGKPRWLQPRWLLWLKDNYPDQMETLLKDARQDSWAWQERARRQQGLEEWAREVAGEPRPRAYMTLNEIVRSVIIVRSPQKSFTIDDVKNDCPDIGRWRIRRMLKRLQKEGKLTRTGRGSLARWRRV